MGILTRFKDIMASNINAVFKKGEKNPEVAVQKYLSQLRCDLGQVKAESDALKIEYQRAEAALDENLAEQEKITRYRDRAKNASATADARTFDRKLAALKEEGARLQQRYDAAKNDMNQYDALREKLTNDINALEAKLNEVKSKLDAARAQDRMNNMASKAGAGSADAMFDKMNQQADAALDRANAMAELSGANNMDEHDEIDDLTSKYDNIPDDAAYTGSDEESGGDSPYISADGIINISGDDE